MTQQNNTPKPRAPKNTKPLEPEAYIRRVRRIRAAAMYEARIRSQKAFDAYLLSVPAREARLLERVPEADRPLAKRLQAALNDEPEPPAIPQALLTEPEPVSAIEVDHSTGKTTRRMVGAGRP